jgi:lipoprotein-releasing system ATP-binding protein
MDDTIMAPVLDQYAKKKSIFEVKGLLKVFKNSDPPVEVLKNLDFELRERETVSIIGASGIGKSTFLHIMGTLDRPDGGTLLFQDQNVFKFTEDQLAKFRNQCIGFVFQFHHLLSDFTALENAMMPGLIQEMPREKAMETAEKILIRVGLKDRLSHKVGELSGGEQQRVAIARALCLNPPVLLADEPTGNLDKKNAILLHDLLMELNEELGMAMIIVTHNMDLASYTARKMTIIDGKLMETN